MKDNKDIEYPFTNGPMPRYWHKLEPYLWAYQKCANCKVEGTKRHKNQHGLKYRWCKECLIAEGKTV